MNSPESVGDEARWAVADLEGHVRVDAMIGSPGRYLATNSATLEQVHLELGDGDWEVGFEGDGVAFCYRGDAEADPVDLGDHFMRTLMQRTRHGVVEFAYRARGRESPVPLADAAGQRKLEDWWERSGCGC